LRKILIIDDNRAVLTRWSAFLEERYQDLEILTFQSPMEALPFFTPEIHLVLMDLEMPGIDGVKLLEYAAGKGVRRSRAIIMSAREADHLHDIFPHGRCLAVINKDDPNQQKALLQILDSVMRRQT